MSSPETQPRHHLFFFSLHYHFILFTDLASAVSSHLFMHCIACTASREHVLLLPTWAFGLLGFWRIGYGDDTVNVGIEIVHFGFLRAKFFDSAAG
jgi:hypothetical protein